MAELADRRIAIIIAEAARSTAPAGSDQKRIADFHRAYLDSAAIERRGLEPLQPFFRSVDDLRDRRDLSKLLGSTIRADVDPLNATSLWTENLFGLFVAQSPTEPSRYLPYLLQGGTGLSNRDDYLSSDPDKQKIKAAYRAYVAEVLALARMDDASARAARIVELETKIAQGQVSHTDSLDPKRAETWRAADFATRAPGVDWAALFQGAGLTSQGRFVAWQPQAISKLSALVASEPLSVWQDWLKFHAINRNASVLPQAFDRLRFGFYGTTLSGQQQPRSREQRAITATSTMLRDAVGKIYAERHFPPASKAALERIGAGVKTAFDRRLQAITWMAPATKAEARRKVARMEIGIGYPGKWRDYSNLEIRSDDAFGNAERIVDHDYRYQLAKIGKAVDRKEWWMPAHEANAANLPLQNAIIMPAGGLEVPIFDPKADAAENYGAAGAAFGHEISHSFDTLGADVDAEGRVRNWWTKADYAKFKAAGEALAKQYSAYRPFPDLALNGDQTLSENIADIAGLSAAYDAYRSSLNGREAPVIDGLTGDQRFFMAYARLWRAKYRDAVLRRIVAGGMHSPTPWRVETVRNHDAWYRAFGVKPGDKLYLPPKQRVRVW